MVHRDRAAHVWPDGKSLEHGRHRRRLERRSGLGGRIAHDSDGGSKRRRRIDTRACFMLRSRGAQAVARPDHLWAGRRRCLVRERVDIRGHPLGKGYGGVAGRDGCRHAGRPLHASEACAELARLPSRATEAAQDRVRIDAAVGRAVRPRGDRRDEADLVAPSGPRPCPRRACDGH